MTAALALADHDPRPGYMVPGTLLLGNADLEDLAAERVQAEIVGAISGPWHYAGWQVQGRVR